MQKIRNESFAVVKGITAGVLIGAIIWFILIWGGVYVWKHYIKPTESKVTKIFDIERSSYADRHILSE